MFRSFLGLIGLGLVVGCLIMRWKAFSRFGERPFFSIIPLVSDYKYDAIINRKWCFTVKLFLQILLIIVTWIWAYYLMSFTSMELNFEYAEYAFESLSHSWRRNNCQRNYSTNLWYN